METPAPINAALGRASKEAGSIVDYSDSAPSESDSSSDDFKQTSSSETIRHSILHTYTNVFGCPAKDLWYGEDGTINQITKLVNLASYQTVKRILVIL